MDLHAVIITETWIKTNKNAERINEQIRMQNGLDIISYNRPGRRQGGGVAIVYDPNELKLSENKVRRDGLEIISARWRVIGDTRDIVL